MLQRIKNKASSTVSDSLQSLLGVGSPDYPLYADFVSAILQDANNSIPEPAHWVGFFSFNPPEIEPSPPESLKDRIKGKAKSVVKNTARSAVEGVLGFGPTSSDVIEKNLEFGDIIDQVDANLEYSSWGVGDKGHLMANRFSTNGGNSVMFINAVQVPGDKFGIERPSMNYNVGGFLKSPITLPRNDLASLKVTFLETNTSLIDFVIRPWLIHSSYESLKYAKSATFDIFNLTKSPSGFRVRKHFKFFNVVPISIQEEDEVYTITDYNKRQTEFVFSHYSLEEGDSLVDSLFDNIKTLAK